MLTNIMKKSSTLIKKPVSVEPQVRTPRKPLLRNLLFARSDRMEARVVEFAMRRGYFVASGSMSRMLSHMGTGPVGLSELARRVGTSRQAVHKLATDAEGIGIVEFIPSEIDKRVKLLQYTRKGLALAAQAASDFILIESELAEAIGQDDVETLRRILAKPWPGDPVK